MSISKITPCLWFPGNAEEAANFYTSIFPDSKIKHVQYYTESGQEHHGQASGSAMLVEFELSGNPFMALNGPPIYKFTEAVSLSVDCKDQAEVDHFYNRLGEGGDETKQRCGWLADKYGLSWQIVPSQMKEMMSDPDRTKVKRMADAMIKMKKLDVAELKKAFDG